ncbi:MAG TPA: decarboxylase [Burkholderiales bacterium]|nr:decarboxylase [Burkholderiales bacterium]
MARIGLLVPSSNTTVEPEFYRALPRGVTLHTARLFLTRIAPDAILGMVQDMETQAKLLASADVDVIVLGATAPSFLNGLGYDRELIAKLEAATGKRATTTSTALVEAIRHIGAKRVVLGSAYDEKVNGIAAAFLRASGLDVADMAGLALVDNLLVGRLSPDTAYDLAMKVNRPDVDAIVLSCTNWQTMDAIEKIERDTGKPVISTTQATIWAALRAIGHTEPIQGYGRLLRELGKAGAKAA